VSVDTFCASQTQASALLTWTQIDNTYISGGTINGNITYTIFYNNMSVNVVNNTSYTITQLTPLTNYNWRVEASFPARKTADGTAFAGSSRTPTYSFTTPNCANPPTAINLQKADPDWCNSAFQFILSWTYSDPEGDVQGSKQIQLDDNPSFTSINYNTGRIYDSFPAYTTSRTLGSYTLDFNKTYYWRIKLWDSQGSESGWFTSSQTLSTPAHAYPNVDFTFSPDKPGAGDKVEFFGQTDASSPNWSWTFEDASPDVANKQNPDTKFQSKGNKIVNMTVADSYGYSCSISKLVNVSTFSYIWREIAPW